jgi:hypothetical protein
MKKDSGILFLLYAQTKHPFEAFPKFFGPQCIHHGVERRRDDVVQHVEQNWNKSGFNLCQMSY